MENVLKRIITKKEKALYAIEDQVEAAKELKEPLYELFRNSRIIKNLNKNIQNIEKVEQFENIQEEAKHIIRDLIHIKEKDNRIKKLGEETISKFRDHRLKIKKDASQEEAQKITLITVEKKEIVRDEKRVIEIVENDKHSIKLAIHHLESITHNKFKLENKIDTIAMISRSLIQINHIYLTTQAIIQLEARIKQEEQELEEGLKKIKSSA